MARLARCDVVDPAQVQIMHCTRLDLDTDRFCKVVSRFGKLFMRAAGTAEHLADEAKRRGVRWLQGPGGRLLSAGSA